MEFWLLNLLILIGFCVILVTCDKPRITREIWGKLTSFIFWNFEISLVLLGRFQNFKKVNSVNLSQIFLLNMWLLVQITIAKLLNQNCFYFVKLPLTVSECFNTNVTLFTWITKLFSRVLKILNYDGLWENKKLADENQRFHWIKSIHWYRLVNIGWLADINLLDYISKNENTVTRHGQ